LDQQIEVTLGSVPPGGLSGRVSKGAPAAEVIRR
jgi:hypothetical protein